MVAPLATARDAGGAGVRRDAPGGDGDADGVRIEHDERRRIWAACRALPEAQRTAVVLRYYEQLEYAEIAELTGVREGSVRSRVSRGLAALRTTLGEERDGEQDDE